MTCKFADPRIDWDRNFNFWISHHCDLESGFLISKEELLCQSKVSAPQKVLLGGKCIKIFRKIEIYSCNALFTPAKLQKRWNLPLQVPELLQMPWLGKSSLVFFVKRMILSKKKKIINKNRDLIKGGGNEGVTILWFFHKKYLFYMMNFLVILSHLYGMKSVNKSYSNRFCWIK